MKRSPLRRNRPMRRSRGTAFPTRVVNHAVEHQGEGCIGPQAGMPGDCLGRPQNDHVRVGGIGMKSESIAVNLARLCGLTHHPMKTEHAEWRKPLLGVIARLHGECADCQREAIETYGKPLEELAHAA